MYEVCCRFCCRPTYSKFRNVIAFWCFGLCNNFAYVIMLSAAVDIIRKHEHPQNNFTSNISGHHVNCTKIGTGSVLLADILPNMIFKFIAPIFIQKLHFHLKIVLLAIVSASLSSGIGDVSFLSMLGFFDKSCVSAWSSGTGAAGLIGSLVYVGLTALTTPEITLRIIIVIPCATFLVYLFVLDRPEHEKFRWYFNYMPLSNSRSRSIHELNASRITYANDISNTFAGRICISIRETVTPTSIQVVSINAFECILHRSSYCFLSLHVDNLTENADDSNNAAVTVNNDGYIQLLTDEDDTILLDNLHTTGVLQQLHPTWQVKLQLLRGIFGSLLCLTSVYFFEYLINQSLFELLYFENSHLTAPEQYRWYQVVYQLGVFISRSSVSIIQIRTTWPMSLLQAGNFVICLLQVIYFNIPHIWIMFIVIFYEGCLGGLTYVNTFYNIIQRAPIVYREYTMAMAAVSDSIGITGAGFLAIPLHNWLCDRQLN
ncbi:unnamed protein product [Heterobilharzia americana]|nr:unnamed protein product [Heterobilharzia americana]